MNKILSQAIRKAVSEYSPNVSDLKQNQAKGPDLFTLTNETELFKMKEGLQLK